MCTHACTHTHITGSNVALLKCDGQLA